MENMITAACSIFDCQTCSHRLRGRCPGCAEGNKAQVVDGENPCGVYQCVTSKNIASCSDCNEAVCTFHRNLEMVCPVRAHFEKKRCYARKMAEHYRDRQAAKTPPHSQHKASEKSIARLQEYLFALEEFMALGIVRVSSEDISRKVGVKDYLIRHDLNQFGEFGRPSIGYDTHLLRDCLLEILYLGEDKNIVWVGAARLAGDPFLLKRFELHNYNVVAILDPEPDQSPSHIDGVDVLPLDKLSDVAATVDTLGAILAVRREIAQPVADTLIAAGVQGILNLSSSVIMAPPSVCVRNVDIVAELCTLHYNCHAMHDDLESLK